ncbi:MAG TPA: hypothetical protein DCX03_10410 [Bacteroidales bacterium]|jgi:predicted DNA-binding protein (UPF0251 family)|nr:DUF134 domain-containing protein [Sedimentibacter sp.]HAW59402.1 hypothetical protein [Bacteroidales bacterium]
MPRPKRIRKVANPPHFKGFRPIGLAEENNPVILNYEEYEAIRLSDYELYSQFEAAQIMNVSRPTFTRIYESAKRKVAQAFVHGKAIVFEGGKVYFDSEWYFCNNCGCWFNHPADEQEVKYCALCGSSDILQCSDNTESISIEDNCICPECGYEKPQTLGKPCKKEICPNCNCLMMRKGAPFYHRMRNNKYQ